MARIAQTEVHTARDVEVIAHVGCILRGNGPPAGQIRDFVDADKAKKHPAGLQFEPEPGQLLMCNFSLGFREPEIVKTRPVLVISPKYHEKRGIVTVVPISSQPPHTVRPHHLKLPAGTVPGKKYKQAWIKGDLIQTVALHRLDRFKIGRRTYLAPFIDSDLLRAVRRCVLHATGMACLTDHL